MNGISERIGGNSGGGSEIAIISDVKPSGTGGGAFTSGSYQTRVLNTLSDPNSIVASLSSNQFILPAGSYMVEASVPAYGVSNHKAKLRNITDSTDDIIGTSHYTDNATRNTTNFSLVSGVVTIGSSKTFEIQHRCAVTLSSGLGSACSFGDVEVYTVVKITKLS